MMNDTINLHGKPYYSLDAYCKNTFGEKLYKITLNANMTCPNRDGTLDTRGCIFCSGGGSGDFAQSITGSGNYNNNMKAETTIPTTTVSLDQAIKHSFEYGKKQLSHKRPVQRYIVYFQAFTNTYAPIGYLRDIYRSALSIPEAAGISIATRPDCMGKDVIALLKELKKEYPSKFIWIELGLQTIHEDTAAFIRRGYPFSCFEQAIHNLDEIDIPTIVHTILGLPGETQDMVLQTITCLNKLPVWGIKLQLLHVLKGTDLADYYIGGDYTPLTLEEYLFLLIDCIEHLRPDMVIHRLTGDAPRDLLLAPMWSEKKRTFLNELHKAMKQQASFQGKALKSIDTL